MSAHHVPFRQSDGATGLEKELEEVGHDESERNTEEVTC
jgi:hypothetical protein